MNDGEHQQDWTKAFTFAFLIGLFFFLFFGFLQTDRPLWQDESMIVANLGLPWDRYFAALPFYDQAAPPLALLTQNMLWLISGGDIATTRVFLLALMALVIGSVGFSAIRRRDTVMLLALILLMTTPLVLRYATEFKHYIFEFIAALILVHTAIRLRTDRRRSAAFFLVLSITLSFFSFSSMFVSVVVFWDAVAFRTQGRMRATWLASLIGFLVIWVGLYVLVFKPAIYFQLTNFPQAYDSNTLFAQLKTSTFGFVAPLILLFRPVYFTSGIITGAVALILSVILSRGASWSAPSLQDPKLLLLRIGFGLIGLLLLLSLVGYYPLFSARQLLFTYPIKAVALAAMVFLVATKSAEWRTFQRVIVLTAFVFVFPNAYQTAQYTLSRDYVFQDTQALFAHVKASSDVPVVPDLLFSSTLQYFVGRDNEAGLTILGNLPTETQEMASSEDVLARLNSDETAKLRNHIWLPLRQADSYQSYTDYIMRIAGNEGRITFAAVQFTTTKEAFLVASAEKFGCTARQVFAGPSVIAFDVMCPSFAR